MNLKNKNLEDWLKKQKKEDFPDYGNIDYYSRYVTIKDHLNTYVHKDVTTFASIKDGGYLTDHGPDHIKNVIRNASEIVNTPKSKFRLTPYEVYILLVAIHFHDVGHIEGGRKNHEKNAMKVIMELGNLVGINDVEKRYIYKIVQAHGGDINGDKDKISYLEKEAVVLNHSIRVQLLASILRFADELSDDSTRASRYLVAKDGIPEKCSEVYHYYAKCLHSVKIDRDQKTVEMHFELRTEHVSRKYGKNAGERYLLDEIYERTIKTYCECLYCMRFMPSEIQLRSVKVNIEFFDKIDKIIDYETDESWGDFMDPIKYELAEKGYPSLRSKDIFSICPDDFSGEYEKLTGAKLNRLFRRKKLGGKNYG